jgi:hypothetical protein
VEDANMSPLWKKLVVCLFALPSLALGSPSAVEAEIIGTLEALDATQRERDLETVSAALAGEEVRRQLARYGVEPEQVDARVAALTDEELRALAERVESMPAGGVDAFAVIGVVFIVLLILELVGAIDIFKRFP